MSAFWIFFICETSKMLRKDPAHPRGQFTKSPHAFKIKHTPSEVFRLSSVCVCAASQHQQLAGKTFGGFKVAVGLTSKITDCKDKSNSQPLPAHSGALWVSQAEGGGCRKFTRVSVCINHCRGHTSPCCYTIKPI